MLSKSEYQGLIATIEISSNPNFLKSIIDIKNSDDFIDESEVEW